MDVRRSLWIMLGVHIRYRSPRLIERVSVVMNVWVHGTSSQWKILRSSLGTGCGRSSIKDASGHTVAGAISCVAVRESASIDDLLRATLTCSSLFPSSLLLPLTFSLLHLHSFIGAALRHTCKRASSRATSVQNSKLNQRTFRRQEPSSPTEFSFCNENATFFSSIHPSPQRRLPAPQIP
jgi:hypothetical protein